MLCRRTHPFPLEHRNARRWFVNRIADSQLFHLLIQRLGHGIDAFLPGCRFRRLQKRLCRLTVLAVFDDVGQLGIAAAVRAGFCEADLDVVVTIPVQLGGRKAECALQFARGAGFELCLSADNGGKIALDSLQHDLTTGLQDDIRHAVKVAAELGNLQKEILRHFHVALSQWSAPPFSPVPRCTFHDPLHSPRTQYRSDNHRR